MFNRTKQLNYLKHKTYNSSVDASIEKSNKKPNCVSKWYAINVNYNHDDLVPIPIGNDSNQKKTVTSINFSESISNEKVNKLYLNFNLTLVKHRYNIESVL